MKKTNEPSLSPTEIIEIASDAYPDGLISAYWDAKKETPYYESGFGDTLAYFIAAEIASVYDSGDEDDGTLNLGRARRAIESAIRDLKAVNGALEEKQCELKSLRSGKKP